MTTLIACLIAATTTPAPRTVGELAWFDSCGLQVVDLATAEGTATVYLPKVVLGGDRISGSIFWSGSSRSDAKVRIGGKEVGVNGQGFTIEVGSDAKDLPIALDSQGQSVSATAKLVDGAKSPTEFAISPVAASGGALQVAGPFDGNRYNTELALDGRKVGVLTESPRACTVSTFGMANGRHRAVASEQGRVCADAGFNSIFARLEATRISKSADGIRMVVEGLDGLEDRAFPITISLVNESPEKLRFLNDFTSIPVSEVKNGAWTGVVPIKALRAGDFRAVTFPRA